MGTLQHPGTDGPTAAAPLRLRRRRRFDAGDAPTASESPLAGSAVSAAARRRSTPDAAGAAAAVLPGRSREDHPRGRRPRAGVRRPDGAQGLGASQHAPCCCEPGRMAIGRNRERTMPKIDKDAAPQSSGTRYPPPFDKPCQKRSWRRLGDAAGLTQFGVNLLRLPPGVWSSQRHWHAHEDEFVYVLDGEVVLVTDAGEEILRAGDCAGFKAGDRDGHCLQNRTPRDAELLVVGSRHDADHGEYPDIDMVFTSGRYAGAGAYRHKDGSPY
jgi:uncharacterized cupin superfamily protein